MERFETGSLTAIHWLAIGLAGLSGAIHLLLAAIVPAFALRASFLVAGVGFFVGIGLVMADHERTWIYLLGLPFTGGQVVLWYLIIGPTPGSIGVIDAVDKSAQLVLVVLLVVLYARER
ncbi:DUF7475 family protein [Halalkalicoccus tibetensis]|uniref:Uncharacterized protein n=1 Tax=Halalkalicoccus tibetensis TaxID=175632 RepID=A0ABD5V1G5_9EURY